VGKLQLGGSGHRELSVTKAKAVTARRAILYKEHYCWSMMQKKLM
jgi:hypothetical protein